MGVYINGMEMPKCCGDCFFNRQTGEGWRCTAAYPDRRRDFGNPLERPGWCPLIPVQSHGRLIDADALCNRLEKAGKIKPYLESGLNLAISFALTAPTIIPAEEASECLNASTV